MITYCVRFFPAAGFRDHNEGIPGFRGQYGFFWSSSSYDADRKLHAIFNVSDVGLSNWRGPYGYSIRCVAQYELVATAVSTVLDSPLKRGGRGCVISEASIQNYNYLCYTFWIKQF